LSVAVSFGTESNDTVRTAGGAVAVGNGTLTGLTAMGSAGPIALGVTGELSSTVDDIASRTIGGLAGVRLPISPRLRVVALGEAGKGLFGGDGNDTAYQVGGFATGAALQIGIRFDTTQLRSRRVQQASDRAPPS
jgi:hypothetical protein